MSNADGTPSDSEGERIRNAARLSRLALESLPSGVMIVAPDGTIAGVNARLERQFGYPRHEIIGAPAELLLPGGLHAGDLPARRKDGSQIPVAVELSSFTDEDETFVLASIVDVSTRRPGEDGHRRALADLVRFERLIGDLAARFVDLEADRVDDAIEYALHRILEALDPDRTTVFQFSEAGEDLVLTHHVSRAGSPPLPARTIENRIAGAVSFSSSRELPSWPPEILGRLDLMAKTVGCALARNQADAALRASEQRFHTLGDNTPVMIWMSGSDKLCTWVNRQWLEFVGQPLESQIGLGWTTNVHPDDLASSMKVYRDTFDARQPFTMEHRLRRHDGEWRWILAKGAPNYLAESVFDGYVGTCIDITELKLAEQQLERLSDQLQAENLYLRSEVHDLVGGGDFVGKNSAIRRVLAMIQQVAPTNSTVLLLGETGTGKELLARQIHELSARRDRAMVTVNCSAIPASLIESELFGREKGAFTGAVARQMGRFELADHSTIFLDEIGELPPDVQVKLLRVLEERQIERLGSAKAVRVDTRIIAATHRNLERQIVEGTFREDLFYRLNVFPVHVPPLWERREDIPLLVWRFVEQFSKAMDKRIDAIDRESMDALQQYSWPGNIRELRNVVERAMIVAKGTRLMIVPPTPAGAPMKGSTKLTDVEREHIRRVLEAAGWRIRGEDGAADRLGLRPTTLETRMARLGITRPRRH